jgi:tRNA(Ile)-lysidine synthase
VHKLVQPVLLYTRKHKLLRAGDRVGVAVSGGADSVALLRLMLEMREEMGLVVSVLHLNHQLRGEESDLDETFVRELADANRVELISRRCDIRHHSAKKNIGIEAAARQLRYAFFSEILREDACSKVATAHTLDDQAETVLLKLARGAGTRGMAGIWPQLAISQADSLAIVRPLLGTHRAELREFLSDISQPWREDSSNRDLRHMRNRIRHGILPRIERHVNANIRETFAEMAEIARAEEEYWAAEVERRINDFWRDGCLDLAKLEAAPPALQRRLVRAVAESLDLHLEFQHVEEVLALAPHATASLPNARTARRSGDFIKFDEIASLTAGYTYSLSVPGEIEVPEIGSRLKTELTGCSETDALLDAGFAHRELIVRNWHPGERFWPAHTKRPRKIKELLQDRHVTGEPKKSWPVIASGAEVVWMRGFGVRRDCQAKDGLGILIREQSRGNQ